ncbi:hypothetical protein NBRC116597_20700 [Phaeobacter sp. NW0010-22]
MEPGSIILFVGIIVGACILGGAVYSGLAKIAEAIGKLEN